MSDKVAVVLFNLGGPDGPDAVRPFLKNLFRDKAIIRAPLPIRWFLARFISTMRAPSARANYAKMGGGSPLLPETKKQAEALEAELKASGVDAKCFIAMRYWHPFAKQTVREVEAWGADRVVLLPLYPQFSTTTTGSSIEDWKRSGGRADATVCCYPTEFGLIEAHAAKLVERWKGAGEPENIRVLLSAHGLPEVVIEGGDPYQWQVERTAAALRPLLPEQWEIEVCYQSRVGPLKWIGPATDVAIRKAAADGKGILLTPIAFVSEHIETLVELDEEYKLVAEELGVKTYLRAGALGVQKEFIIGLSKVVQGTLSGFSSEPQSHCGGRLCPASWSACPNHRPLAAA